MHQGDPSTRNSQSYFLVMIAALLATTPTLAETGPCSIDIAELEKTVRLPQVEPLSEPAHSQFSATVARAKRLDMYGDLIGCTGALNAVRSMYVLVDKG